MKYCGNGVSAGIASGRIYTYSPFIPHVGSGEVSCKDIPDILCKFHALKETALNELALIQTRLSAEYPEKAKIFSAHMEILEDEELSDSICHKIQDEHYALDYAIDTAFNEFIVLLSNAGDPLIRSRTTDLKDVKNRLLRILADIPEKNLSALPENVIVVTHDLLPSETATMDREHILGIITEIGGETSHSAIIARSYGIPAILGVPDAVALLPEGETIIMNANTGEITTSPTPEQIAESEKLKKILYQKAEKQKLFLPQPCLTKDNMAIKIGLNIGNPLEKELELLKYTDYIGLFRTEFLYMNSDHMPTEEEQFQAYRKVLEMANGKPVTLRTLDIGGDKTLPYFDLPREDNPFLGTRALRLCFEHPDIFITQLRAALRASVYGNLKIMFPMVGSPGDFDRAMEVVNQVKQSLDLEQIPYSRSVQFGIMIEIPSIALLAEKIAAKADFASIGTNDLCQYLSAADRMNQNVTPYYNAAIPAALRLIHYVAQCFSKEGKTVSVCGEMGGNISYAPLLVGLGIQELSMSASSIASIKERLSLFASDELSNMGKKALSLDSTESVIAYMDNMTSISDTKGENYV